MQLSPQSSLTGKLIMKHFRPIRSVYHGDRYLGCALYSARGWQVHDAAGKRIGEYADEDQAAKRLRGLAARQST
jgi:hypothetical protein